jgi:hypothetical protein
LLSSGCCTEHSAGAEPEELAGTDRRVVAPAAALLIGSN